MKDEAITRVLLIRHGETPWNDERRYQGHSQVRLSAKGRAQAGLVARRLARRSIDALYSSDLQRARETAEIIARAAKRPLEVRVDPRLREMNFGEWEGLTFDEIQERYPELARAWLADPLQVRSPGGETFAEVEERAVTALRAIAAGHAGETVAVVTHGGPLRALIRHYLGSPPAAAWRFELSTGGISQVNFLWGEGVNRWDEYVEKHEVVVINDIAHQDYF